MVREKLPQEVFRLTENLRPCSYLPDKRASLEYRLFPSLSPAQLESLLERGWRRFGMHLFRPACPECAHCVPIRIDVANFRPSKSQRKARNKNSHIRYSVHPPTVTDKHIQIYNRWHRDMTDRRDWPEQQSDALEYTEGFLAGNFPSLREIRYFDQEQLIGIGLIDVMPRSLSSVYFYHDPSWRSLSPGTFSILCEIEIARRLQRDYVYLGYWISGCSSMAYKNRFRPSETLQGYPADEAEVNWQGHHC